jgi:hypothetical protein
MNSSTALLGCEMRSKYTAQEFFDILDDPLETMELPIAKV